MSEATQLEIPLQAPPIACAPPTLGDKVRSAGLWAAGLSWLVPMLGGMTVLHKLLPSRRLEPLNRLYCAGQLKLLGATWRAEVDPSVDPGGVYMFLQNHTNHFDHVACYNATPHFKQGLELRKHFDYPFYGWFMKARGTVAVERGRGGQSSEVMAAMRAEVARGHSILAFPEGTRTTTGRVASFRKGLFYIARDLGIPVVPVAVTGMYEIMRKGSYLLRPKGTITVHVEAPIPTADLSDSGVERLARTCQRIISRHVDSYWNDAAQRSGRQRS